MPTNREQARPGHAAQQPRGLVGYLLSWIAWWIKACLDAWEETLNSLLREGLSITQRAINGASAWTLSVFNRDYKAQLRGRWTVLQEQYSWWGRDTETRSSTLNAVLARKFSDDENTPNGGTAAAAAAPAGVHASQDGLRHRKHRDDVSKKQQQQQQQQEAVHPAMQASTPLAKATATGLSEIEPLPDSQQQTGPQHTQQQHSPHRQQQQHHPSNSAATEGHMQAPSGSPEAEAAAQQQWWGQPATWLNEIADEATEAAAAAQEAAAAAVHQAASTMSHAVEEAAATAAGWARSMRAVFVEPPAGWGVQEAIKQTGLLEDVSLQGQLFISRIFDKLRRLLGKLTFSAVPATPSSAALAARQRQGWGMHRFGSTSSSTSMGSSPGHASSAVQPGSPGIWNRLRHPLASSGGGSAEAGHPAAGPGAARAGGSTAAAAAGGRLKLRSVTSVDLPRTHRLSLDSQDSDEGQSTSSDTSSDAYDDVQEGMSSEVSCSSSSSSWVHPDAGLSAAEMATSAAADLADLPGPPLTVRVPHNALNIPGSVSNSGRGGGQAYGRVSFASGAPGSSSSSQLHPHGPGAGVDEGSVANATPFGTMHVQQQQHALLSKQQQQQHTHGTQQHHQQQQVTGSGLGTAGQGSKVAATRRNGSSSSRTSRSSRGHRARAATGDLKEPHGLGAVLPGRGRRWLQRSHSGPAVSVLRDVSSAGQVIRMAGYPLEVHEVVTPDGYLLRMERIPQPTSTEAVFMMHGVLDTSLTWVAGGITGSQAFAAWDRGFDVWLGTSRSNPPHEAADPARRGSAYWVYSHNEVATNDMGAQVDHIHAIKMRELTALGRTGSSSGRRASTHDPTAARSGRRPSGRRSSGSTAASSRPIPEHADILAGVLDADALVGVQPIDGQAAAVPADAGVVAGKQLVCGGAGAAGDSSAGSQTGASAEQQRSGAGSGVNVAFAVVGSGREGSSRAGSSRGAAADMARAQSAAEIDQEAAAEAAAAFSRHKAVLVAAGISPNISTSAGACAMPDQQQQQQNAGDGTDGDPTHQQLTAVQRVASPLTPTAAAAASAAARAANAISAAVATAGSAVATAAVAAGGIISMAAAGGPSGGEPPAADTGVQEDAGTGFSTAPESRSSSTVSAKPAASGLLERLLGGTVPVSSQGADASGYGGWMRSPGGLQTQGSGMRHVASAPDVSVLAGLLAGTAEQDGTAAGSTSGTQGPEEAGGGVASTAAAGAERADSSSRSNSGGAGAPAGHTNSSSSSRHARRGSWPRCSASHIPDAGFAEPQGQHMPPAGAECALPVGSQAAEQQQQGSPAGQQQQQLGLSPFSQQQQQQPAQQQLELLSKQQQQHQQQQELTLLQEQQQQQPPPQQPPPGTHHISGRTSQQAGVGGSRSSSRKPPIPAATGDITTPGAAAAAPPPPTPAPHVHPAFSAAVRSSSWGVESRPYNLRVVCHSLGGLLLLIYCTQRARAGRPHHISRLILLSPAGFHPIIPGMFKPLVYVWRPLMLWMQLVWRQQGFPVHLPTFVARMLAFKLSIDTSKLPAVGDLLRSMARLLLGGDRSAWDRALLMPHYTAAGMPLLSSRQVLHFIQLHLTGRCQLYDYGSVGANVAAYQQRTPPLVSDSYHMLRDVPVHLVAGKHDGVIPASNIQHHYAAMRAAGMDVSYREFDYGHMDFTFSAKEELGWYVMSLLMRT